MATMTTDVLIVGGGLVGVSTAAALVSYGVRRVVVAERDTVASGATGKSSGVVRCHYGVPELAAMAWWSLARFENAMDVFGADVGFHQVGYVVAVNASNESPLRANVALHRKLGIDVDLIGASELRALWPGIATDDLSLAAYEPRGGYGDAYSLATAQAKRARAAGAVIQQFMAVRELRTTADGSRVTGAVFGDGTEVAAGTVIVAAGPWSVGLVAAAGVGLPIRTQREMVLLVEPRSRLSRMVPVFSDLVDLQYSRPERSGQLLVGNSDHTSPEYVDPDRYDNGASPAYLESAVNKIAGRFPVLADAALASSYAGIYDVTPDYNPVIGSVGPEGLLVAAGFSGHGFKIAPAVGEMVASAVVGGDSPVPGAALDVFTLSRFAEQRPLVSRHPYAGAGEMR
jgi:sarcosine oxidase, subunit beta